MPLRIGILWGRGGGLRIGVLGGGIPLGLESWKGGGGVVRIGVLGGEGGGGVLRIGVLSGGWGLRTGVLRGVGVSGLEF